jgi:chromosome segregation ATPase
MSDELQKELDRLKAEVSTQRAAIDKLSRDLAGAHDDVKEVRGEARDRRLEGKKLTEQLELVGKERDEFKTRAEADPEGLRKSIGDAQGLIRSLKHDGAFAKIAKALKVNNASKFADLVKLAAYQPEGDEPDEAKIAAAFGEALKSRPWLMDAADAGKTAAATTTTAKSAIGGGPLLRERVSGRL